MLGVYSVQSHRLTLYQLSYSHRRTIHYSLRYFLATEKWTTGGAENRGECATSSANLHPKESGQTHFLYESTGSRRASKFSYRDCKEQGQTLTVR